jgi:hypothetical protein
MSVTRSDQTRLVERISPLSGVGFAALAFVGVGFWRDLGFLDPPEDLAATYVDDSGAVLAGCQVFVLAAFLLVWFGSSLRSAVRATDRGEERLANAAFGGAVAAAALMLAAAAAHAAGALRADDAGAIDPQVAGSLSDLATLLYAAAAPVALGVTAAATAVASLRARELLPTWLAWLTALLAVGLLVLPINFIVVLAFLVWAAVVGILLYLSPGRQAEAASA